MPASIRLPKRAPITGRGCSTLPDGVGGTITGGLMRPLDPMGPLARRAPEDAMTSAGLTGAASRFAASDAARAFETRDWDVALSDGSRITFAFLPTARVRADA